MDNQNLEQRLSKESRKRRIHSNKVFERLERFATGYVNSCSKEKRKGIRAEVMSYIESELSNEQDIAFKNISIMYFNEFVGVLRRKNLPIKETCQVLDILAADYAESDSFDKKEIDKAASCYINQKFSDYPKLKTEFIEYYKNSREHYSEFYTNMKTTE